MMSPTPCAENSFRQLQHKEAGSTDLLRAKDLYPLEDGETFGQDSFLYRKIYSNKTLTLFV